MFTRREAVIGGIAAGLASGLATASPARADTSVLRADVAILKDAFETLHPGLRRYLAPGDLDGVFARLESAFVQATAIEDQFLALSRATAAVRCGHTHPNPFNQADGVTDRLLAGRRHLPFEFRWSGETMICTRDLTGLGRFGPGTEIAAINRNAVTDLQARLLPLVRADGANDAKRRSLLELQGRSRFETLDLLLPRVLTLEEGASFTLASGETVDARLLVQAERDGARRQNAGETDAQWQFAIGDDGVAVLTMPTWSVYNSDFDWKGWLNGKLDMAVSARARGIVVDLRGNEGGLDCGDPVLERMTGLKPAPLPARRVVRYRSVPDRLRPYLDTYDNDLFDWGDTVTGPDADGFFDRAAPAAATDAQSAPAPRFGGRLVVLCDASNSSATFNFALAVRRGGLGLLVGEPTGGNLRGINGSGYFFLRLPGSGLEVDIPLVATFPPGNPPDRGLTPDVTVALRPEDIRAGRDLTLEVGRRLAAG